MVQNMISSYLEQKALPTIPCQIDIEGLAKMKQSLRAQQFQNTFVMYEWEPHLDKTFFGAKSATNNTKTCQVDIDGLAKMKVAESTTISEHSCYV